jgi:hypothetical protein
MLTTFEKQRIADLTKKLGDKYPTEYTYGSKCSLWGRALKDEHVTSELYESAAEYYGLLWFYTGD